MHDLLIIGGGPGGCAAALRAARGGLSVALFEPRQVGGTCLNRGCIPTKALLHGAKPGCDWSQLAAEKESVVATLRSGMEKQLKAAKVEVIPAQAVITGPNTARTADGTLWEGRSILVSVGSLPAPLPIPGMDLPGVSNSDGLLDDIRPRDHLLIIGGGVIGVELAWVWASAGCRVTIVEALDRLIANLDRELSQSLTMELKKAGVTVYTGASVAEIQPGPAVRFTHKGEEHTLAADTVLVAAGRKPATAGLFDGVSPAMDRGFLTVDEHFRTSIPSIYAIGDAIGGAMLAHKAEAEGDVVAHLLLGKTPLRGTSPIPSCVYTDPELAQVGLTLDEAKARNIPAVSGKCVMGANGRTLIEGGKRGFVKLVFHKETHALLGGQLCCYRASDLIAELTLAVSLGLTAEQLLRPVRPHPTFAEAVTAAVEAGLEALERSV
ncbi:dihydrolipoyl dehydrogenase family protein [Pseudoflavonifractor phocaeensis]|uniref:dihydrolipoyl dehydrogenase family protein n=1 Tax=Pseudoflavonifractor phocaeensis TaxID=1870988 RepID=UPI0019593883|nr:FAD-dependent oxidoreductase [Pseudoflavonifractor phocaeensis]MBM6723776.1 FAD-dependent oxidoreductase [Pseudoflavonifractor phocaeensis]